MRAWLLLLAVLATFQTIVRVASTEDLNNIASRFITAISPTERSWQKDTAKAAATSTKITTRIAATALTAAVYNPVNDILEPFLRKSTDSSSVLRENSDQNKNQNKTSESSNYLNKSKVIQIKNIQEFEGNERTIQSKQLRNEQATTDLVTKSEIGSVQKIDSKTQTMAVKEQQITKEKATTGSTAVENKAGTQVPDHRNQDAENISATDRISVNTRQNEDPKIYEQQNEQSASTHSSDNAIVDEDENENENEPATYSNKEIIGEIIQRDPSTLVEIENSLLSIFNMKRPPKIDRSKIVIPDAMKKLYAEITGHELNSVNIPKPGLLTKSANTVRSFTHQDSKIDDRFPHHHRFRLYFDIKSIPAEEKLKAAELQLARDAISHVALHPRLANRTRYQVLVYDITRVGVRGKREPSYLLLDNKTIRLNSTDTVSLDVQPAVNRWLASPKKNYGLLVEVRTSRSLKPAPHHHVRLRRSADELHEHWQHKQPLLFTYTDDGRHKARSIRDVSARSKRAGHHRRPHRRKNNEEICRRHSLYVDFADVGWSDWIVAPPGYDAFYCHGKCPFPLADHLNSTNHAVVQTLVNNLNPGKAPKACCVPTQLEGISMLYLNDHNTVVLKNYQDMTVVGCGCR